MLLVNIFCEPNLVFFTYLTVEKSMVKKYKQTYKAYLGFLIQTYYIVESQTLMNWLLGVNKNVVI